LKRNRPKKLLAPKPFGIKKLFHCGSNFDRLTPLEQWVEQNKAPDRLIATHLDKGVVDRTRPLCPYPQVAIYSGTGSTDDAANFVCKVR
jgi:feruloyl esterase